jgi:hypothetical protein
MSAPGTPSASEPSSRSRTNSGGSAAPRLPLIRFRLHIVGLRVDIVGLRVALVHMIGFEDMARVHMALVHSVRAALTHMMVAGTGATVPVRR